MKKSAVLLMTLIISAAAIAQQANLKTFYVNDEMKKDIVTFTSKAPLETIVGRTSEVVGFVTVDPTDIKGSAKGRFEVDLATLKTGISLRDQHMREKYLEVDKYPKAIFDLTGVAEAGSNALEDKKNIDLTLTGNFTIHGVTKSISIPATITYLKESEETKQRLPGDLMHIVVQFNVLLGDYSIKRPQFVILKLDENQRVDIDLFASTGVPPVDFVPK